jgi:hypothetical protein
MGFGLMGAPRTLAERLLRAMLRLAPAERRAWVEAMLRELDFIGLDEKGDDWAALFWALGCTGAIFRESLRGLCAWLWKRCAELLGIQSSEEDNKMNSTGKKTLGVLAGMGIALALGVVAFLLSNGIANLLLAVGIPRTMWSHILTIMLPVEVIVVVAAIMLWRRQRAPVAIGLLVPAVGMAAHVAIFLASR